LDPHDIAVQAAASQQDLSYVRCTGFVGCDCSPKSICACLADPNCTAAQCPKLPWVSMSGAQCLAKGGQILSPKVISSRSVDIDRDLKPDEQTALNVSGHTQPVSPPGVVSGDSLLSAAAEPEFDPEVDPELDLPSNAALDRALDEVVGETLVGKPV
jgi:hypothetical protein